MYIYIYSTIIKTLKGPARGWRSPEPRRASYGAPGAP